MMFITITLLMTILRFNSITCDSSFKSNIQKHKKSKSLEAKIVNGVPVLIQDYPFAAQFMNLGGICGGVIISNWAVCTAAHCFKKSKDPGGMTIFVGAQYVFDMNSDKYSVLSFMIHEEYDKSMAFANDIALVFPEIQIIFSETVHRAIIVSHDKWMNENERNFTVTGWGMTMENGDMSEVGLQMTNLRYVSPRNCSIMHKDSFSPDMFCLYGEGLNDVCSGDSGGAVIWNDQLVGLTSHGSGCARPGKPTLFTNVFYLKSWIEENMAIFFEEILCTNPLEEI